MYKDFKIIPINTKIGKLKIISNIIEDIKTCNKRKRYKYNCICDCNKTVIKYHADLLSAIRLKKEMNCGCYKNRKTGPNHKSYTGYNDINGGYWSRLIYSAKKRKIEFSIDKKYVWDLFLKQEKKCAISGINIYLCNSETKRISNLNLQTASLDRIDSSKGYIEGNVWWVDKDINKLKLDHPLEKFLDICGQIYLHNKEKIQKIDIPDWTTYFLEIAKVVSTRSRDAQTKHGCVITDRNHHIIGTGYNSFPRESFDSILPNLRPEKYDFVTHAERNSLSNLTISPWTIEKGAIAYITGKPCLDCLYALWNTNITTIYVLNRQGSVLEEKDNEKFNFFITTHNIEYNIVNEAGVTIESY